MGYRIIDMKGVAHEVPADVESAGGDALEAWAKKHVPGYPFPVAAAPPPAKAGASITVTPNEGKE